MRIQVQVKPNARQPGIVKAADGRLTVKVKAPPVDGKANREVLESLAVYFGVSPSQVCLLRGATSQYKWVEIDLPNEVEHQKQ